MFDDVRPRAFNGLPALANATTNQASMIQISGSSSRPMVDLQRGDYQDLDQLANAARPFVKAAYRIGQVQDTRGVARAIAPRPPGALAVYTRYPRRCWARP